MINKLSLRFPEEGGLYVWAKEAFGDFHGFISGWTYWTRAHVLGMTDNYGRPLLNINAASIDGVDTMLGRPVVYAQQLPNTAASASRTIVLADFEATYTLRTVRGSYQILRLAERYADKLCVGFIAYARGGGYLNALNGAKAAVKLVQHS